MCGLFLLSSAAAQDMPDNVRQAYIDYEAAMNAGDAPALLEAASRAYEGGAEARIDQATLATLAENVGFAATLNQDFDTAQEAWRNSGRLSDRADVDPVDRAWRWHNAALLALHNQDRDDAYACSRRASSALNDLEGGYGEAVDFAAESYVTTAALALGAGRMNSARDAAQRSIEVYEQVLEVPVQGYGLALFYAGITKTLDGETVAANYFLHMAGDVMEGVAPDHPDMGMLRAARSTARGDLFDDGELDESAHAEVQARLAANHFHADLYQTVDAEAEAAEQVAAAEAHEEAECCDAAPLERRRPYYPMNAAAAGLEGVIYVRFDITETGATANVEVLGAFPPGVFDESTLEAVAGWEYEPATRDGVPVRRTGVETRFDFALSDSLRR